MSELLRGWRLLLTRPTDDCRALAQTLSEQGAYAHCMPLLAVEALPLGVEQQSLLAQLASYDGVLVVSKPAAHFVLVALKQSGALLSLPVRWFTVGAASAAILQAAGLEVHYPQAGDDSEALLAHPLFRQVFSRTAARLLIVRADEGRDWLAEHLRGQGVKVDYLPLYRRSLPSYPEGLLWQQVHGKGLNALVVSSGQGFRHLQQLAAEHWSQIAELPLFVPSERVAQLARAAGAKIVINCRGASASALQAALKNTPLPTS